jgi:glucose dehydrogenase
MGRVTVDRRSFLAGMAGMIAALSTPGSSFNSQAVDEDPRSRRPIGHFGDIDPNTIFDVCIIGSGFAGAALGEALVRHGIKTAILESGSDHQVKPVDHRFQNLNAFRSVGPIDYPVNSSRVRGVGGTSWIWGGICTRLHPKDFEQNHYTPAGAAWPITYDDLRLYYQKAEKILRVRGGPGSEYGPPRDTAYPFPPDRDVLRLQSMLSNAGISITDMPYSTSEKSNVSLLSDRYGPRVQMTERLIPDFQSSSYGNLFSEVTVTRLLVEDTGVVKGVEVRDLDRNIKILRARAYVVACGGLESPRLLLLSRSTGFPNGVGNNHDLVGRYFMEHWPASLVGHVKLGWNDFNFFALKAMSYQFLQKFKNLGLGGMTLYFHLEGALDSREILSWNIGKSLNKILARQLDITVGTEMKPSRENRVTLDKDAKDYFGSPMGNLHLKQSADDVRTVDLGKQIARKIFSDLGVERVEESARNFWAHHHMGTCRMGDNPRTSVVDRNLQVHGTNNLFVAGSAPFVTSGVAHPTLTLTALSLRLSDYLRTQFQNGALPSIFVTRRERLLRRERAQ